MKETVEALVQLPFWDKLSENQKEEVTYNARTVKYSKGARIYDRGDDCLGLLIVKSGQVCVYMLSDEGREITLFRLEKGEFCVLTASCVIKQIAFDVHVDAETDTELIILNSNIFARLMNENIYLESFVFKHMSERFSDVMWFMQQVLFKRFDSRLAGFLYDEIVKTGQNSIEMTHEQIAKHLASAREVVSRMLKQFSNNGIVDNKRGVIIVKDKEKLKSLL